MRARLRLIAGQPVGLGNRGAVLFWIAVSWLTLAAAVAFEGWRPWPSLISAAPGAAVYRHIATASAAMWAACGVVALVAALSRRRHDRLDRVGFAVAIIPPAITFVMWLGKVVRLAVPGVLDPGNLGEAVLAAVASLACVGVIATVAGWPEPHVPASRIERRRGAPWLKSPG